MARILVAARSSQRAADASRQALELLGGGHNVTVLMVVHPSLVGAPVTDGGEAASGRLELSDETKPEDVLATANRAEAEARSDLDDALRSVHLGHQLRVRVEIGDPGETFVRVATEEQADLVVLGRRNRSLASRLRLGSVTHYVLEHAHCPVLVVHEASD